ncbi:MAG: hypothetical protein SVO01_06290 [Thermotogota bacterium]|nr:hypothetical protein [Thermotogota bacterium]
MITSSGAKCDVCGNYILPTKPDEMVHSFSVRGIKKKLHCDNACKKVLSEIKGDWTKLPDGPLRKSFEKAYKQLTEGE